MSIRSKVNELISSVKDAAKRVMSDVRRKLERFYRGVSREARYEITRVGDELRDAYPTVAEKLSDIQREFDDRFARGRCEVGSFVDGARSELSGFCSAVAQARRRATQSMSSLCDARQKIGEAENFLSKRFDR